MCRGVLTRWPLRDGRSRREGRRRGSRLHRQSQVRQRPGTVLCPWRAVLVGMSGAQRLFGCARQLLRVARPPVLPEGNLEKPLQRALALARVQVAVESGPDAKTERRQRGCQEGTAPAGESGHAPRFPHCEMRRKPDSGTP